MSSSSVQVEAVQRPAGHSPFAAAGEQLRNPAFLERALPLLLPHDRRLVEQVAHTCQRIAGSPSSNQSMTAFLRNRVSND